LKDGLQHPPSSGSSHTLVHEKMIALAIDSVFYRSDYSDIE